MNDDNTLEGYSEEAYFDTLSLPFKKLLKSICAYVSHSAFGEYDKSKATKKINKPKDWNGYVFHCFVYPAKEEIKAKRKFETFFEKYVDKKMGTFNSVQKQGLGEETALSAFCLSAYIRGYKNLEDFIKKYVSYCDDNQCGFNAFEGHGEILKTIRGERETANRSVNISEGQPDLQSIVKSKYLPLKEPCYVKEKLDSDGGEINLDPYDHYSIPLLGREKQIDGLNEFLNDGREFLILPVIGSSGAGKTRLVTQWLHEHVNIAKEEWHAGILQTNNTSKLQEWEPKCNTLIIIDYIYRAGKAIEIIVEKSKSSRDHKIRLILIDHIFPEKLDDIKYDATLHPIAPDQRAISDLENILHPTLYLANVANKIDILREIIAIASGKEEDSAEVGNALKVILGCEEKQHSNDDTSSNRLDQNGSEHSATAHPLFAILIGQALKQDGVVTEWKRRDLINFYLNNERRLPWRGKNNSDIRESCIGAYVAAATIRRGLSFDVLHDCLIKLELDGTTSNGLNFNNISREEIVARCNHIVSSDNQELLKPFEPDILGESFFLLFFRDFTDKISGVMVDVFMDMVCSENRGSHTENKKPDDVAGKFAEFIHRLARNLSNDDQSHRETKKDWKALSKFLDPKLYPKDSPLRFSVSLAIIKVSDVLKEKNLSHLDELFFNQVDEDDFITAHKKRDDNYYRLEVTSSFVKYFDRSSEDQRNQQTFRDKLFVLFLDNEKRNHIQYGDLMLITGSTGACNVVKLLIELGADAYLTKENLWGALIIALYYGHNLFVAFLIEKSIIDADLINRALLICVSQSRHEAIVTLLIKKGAKINSVDQKGVSALMVASLNGHESIATLLIKKGAKIDLVNRNGFSALMLASYNGHLSVVALLIRNGANINLRCHTDRTALINASQKGHEAVASLLIKKGAKIDLVNKNGLSALMAASSNNHGSVVSLLIDKGAKVNLTSTSSFSSLMLASYHGHASVVNLLIKNGAKIGVISKDGSSSLSLARSQSHQSVVELLLKNGAT